MTYKQTKSYMFIRANNSKQALSRVMKIAKKEKEKIEPYNIEQSTHIRTDWKGKPYIPKQDKIFMIEYLIND